jgi:regulatory protein
MNKEIENSREDALKYALKLLSFRDRSEKEIYERLIQKGFSKSTTENIILYLKEKDFLNDSRLAETLKKSAFERKFLGKSGLKRYLINRGIPNTVIESTIGQEDDYLETALNFISKRSKNIRNIDDNTRQRLMGSLIRRGFSYEIVKRAFKIYFSEEV